MITANATFDWRGFGRALRTAMAARGNPPLKGLAAEIGVTRNDLSRASSGIKVGPAKMFAMADWMGDDARNFYVPPMKSNSSTCLHVKHEGVST